jgi:general secretion pathway protein D
MIGRTVLALICFVLGSLAETSTSGATTASGTSSSTLFTAALPTALPTDPPPPVLTAGSAAVASVGDVFTIPISIANAQGLTSFQFDLDFNPAVIQALSFTDIGTDFAKAASSGGGFLTGITGFTNNTTGVLSGVADSMSGLTTGAGLTPSGVLADVTFKAVAVGSTTLALNNAFLTDAGVPLMGNFTLINGQAKVPEPSSLILLSVAVGAVGILRWRRRG